MPDVLAMERRTVAATFEVRGVDSTEPIIEGYAATFGQPYDLGPFREVIDPAAFTRTLGSGPDLRLLVDHEGQPLARTKSGTLELSADSTGLHMRSTLDPSDPDVQRLIPKMRRKDLDQMSFAFRVPAGGDSWEQGNTLRTLNEINLSGGDVSVVTYPANPATSVGLAVRAQSLLEAETTLASALIAEIRSGKTLSSDNADRLRTIIAAHEQIAGHIDAASQAAADMAASAGLEPDGEAQGDVAAEDDPAEPDSDDQRSSSRLVDLQTALRVAQGFALHTAAPPAA